MEGEGWRNWQDKGMVCKGVVFGSWVCSFNTVLEPSGRSCGTHERSASRLGSLLVKRGGGWVHSN